MGLSASQARLLTITARKSDCEFQSMRYSHEKIALSRDLTDISNEYQNALNATKLVYDYYGVGSTADPLSYGLMMTPSEMNGYMPILTTDTSGRVVLSSKYAAAAKAAGIPNEGFAALPSSIIRNNFLDALQTNGIIKKDVTSLKNINYSQDIGVGNAGTLVTTNYSEMTLKELLDYMEKYDQVPEYNLNKSTANAIFLGSDDDQEARKDAYTKSMIKNWDNDTHIYADSYRGTNGADPAEITAGQSISLVDIITGNYSICHRTTMDSGWRDKELATLGISEPGKGMTDFWEQLLDDLVDMVSASSMPQNENAAAYARIMTEQLLDFSQGYYSTTKNVVDYEKNQNKWFGTNRNMIGAGQYKSGGKPANGSYCNEDYIGLTYVRTNHWTGLGDFDRYDGVSVNISNIAKAFLTYYAEQINGIYDHTYYVSQNGSNRTVKDSSLVDINSKFKFSIATDFGVNTDQSLESGFYDALFNQICLRGWTENDNVSNKEYLQEMYKSGKFFMTTCADDGFYYQGGYATNSMVKEITDEEAIAKAEAKYNTEKQKINHKEEIIDMKMKNLDTEISSLTTEYETIKSVLKNNIDKSFTRYEA